MTDEMEANNNSKTLETFLRDSMNVLRGPLNQSEVFNYVFPLIFFKRISEMIEQPPREDAIFDIPAEATWFSLMGGAEPTGKKINSILSNLEDSTPHMKGLFSHLDYDTFHRIVGNNLIKLIDRMNGIEFHKIPNFPNLFDDMLDWIADSFGHRGGEFRTPKMVSELVVRLASPKPGMKVCDPACGSGGMLIAAHNYVKRNSPDSSDIELYGQDVNVNTRSLCLMNSLLHGIIDAQIELGDTLREPQLIENGSLMKFDRVISSPPISLRNWGQEYAQHDAFERFKYGIPPRNSSDFAFIQHIIAALSDTGKGVMVIPHGPLFRSGPEQRIREKLIEDDIIESVIALPSNLLYGTGISCVVLILNKAKPRNRRKKVQFIDATNRGRKERAQTYFRSADLEWIDRAYKSFTQSKGVVRVVGVDLIAEQNYSLDVARYVKGIPTPLLVRPSDIPTSGKSFEQWIEGLPYPLASILWSYTSRMDAQQKTNSLLHFFEALSQLNTTLMLSAITADPDYFDANFSGAITRDVFTTSSFGGWSLVGTRLASKIRKLLKNTLTQRKCVDVFGGVDELIANLLSDTELCNILDDARKLRNNWSGHSGAVTKKEYSRRLSELEVLLRKTRKIVKERYSSMILALPGIIDRYRDGIYFNIVEELRGTRTPFREIRLETISPLESDSLHFIADGGNKPIKLLPFLRIMHSPETEKNACYFYNRVEPEGVRWITYQFEKESELTLPDDDDVEVIIEMLLPSKTG